MKPYYEHGGIAIYHGDCREILPSVWLGVDAVVTDPPYGINAARERNSQKWRWRDYDVNGWDAERPSADLIRLAVSAGKRAVVWGGNYFTDALPFVPRAKWLVWDKGQTDFSLADCEMAWCSWEGAIRRLLLSRGAAMRDGKQHPTQKPEAVMAWTIRQLDGGDDNRLLLDPFMGSGTTLVAAKRAGRAAIGVELSERYCEIAAKRLSQEVLPLEA
jgi:DNA modification methylase